MTIIVLPIALSKMFDYFPKRPLKFSLKLIELKRLMNKSINFCRIIILKPIFIILPTKFISLIHLMKLIPSIDSIPSLKMSHGCSTNAIPPGRRIRIGSGSSYSQPCITANGDCVSSQLKVRYQCNSMIPLRFNLCDATRGTFRNFLLKLVVEFHSKITYRGFLLSLANRRSGEMVVRHLQIIDDHF